VAGLGSVETEAADGDAGAGNTRFLVDGSRARGAFGYEPQIDLVTGLAMMRDRRLCLSGRTTSVATEAGATDAGGRS
jgi:nucleoside-diphosphate-sugar epimerase